MALAQRSLTQPWCAGDKEGRRGKEESGSATSWREEFSADDLVKSFGGFRLFHLSVCHAQNLRGAQQRQDYLCFPTKLSYTLFFVSEYDDDDVFPTGILQRGKARDHHPNLRAGSNLM